MNLDFIKQKIKKWLSILTILAFDLATLYLSLYIAIVIRNNFLAKILDISSHSGVTRDSTLFLWWIPIIYIFILMTNKLYTLKRPFWDEAKLLIRGIITTFIVVFAFTSLAKVGIRTSRLILVLQPLVAIVLVPLVRRIIKTILYKIGLWRTGVLVININGSDNIHEEFKANKYLGYYVIKEISPPEHKISPELSHTFMEQVKVELKKYNITRVVLTTKHLTNRYIAEFVEKLYFVVPHILIVPTNLGLDLGNADIYHMMYHNQFVLDIKKGLNVRINLILKRLIDIVLSSTALIMLSPLFIVVYILILLEDGQPGFYKQKRFGLNRKEFNFIKFRSMYNGDNDQRIIDYLKKHPEEKESWDKYQKLKGKDPRVLKIGRFIRKFSIDELPQLFNVLKGDMSMVGPRPYMFRELDKLKNYLDRIVAVKPGMTGLWQVSGRNQRTFKERIQLDTWYIQNWTFWLDLVISIKTFKEVFRKAG